MSITNDAVMLGRALAGRIKPRRGPFKLTAAVTYECGQKCTHCRIWKREQSQELTADEWRRIWRDLKHSLSWLDLTGGEVTDREDFAEIAIAAIEECRWLAMLHYPSNGHSPERLESVTKDILSAKPKRLISSISLDGPPKVHDRLRGDKGAYEAAVESYRRIRKLGVEVYFGMTLSPWNMDQLDETMASLQARLPGFTWRDLHVNILHVSPHYFGNEGIKQSDPAALTNIIDRILQERGTPRRPTHILEHMYLKRVPEFLVTGRSPEPCASMAAHAFINPEGTVYPCHIWDNPIGSLRDYDCSLTSLWNTHLAREARKQVEADKCPGCWTPCEAYPTILSNLP